MTTDNPESSTELGVHQAARLEKLRRLEALNIDPWGQRSEARLEPYWARVETDADCRRLEIRSHGRGIVVGQFLSVEERAAFARDLRAALAKSRAAVY